MTSENYRSEAASCWSSLRTNPDDNSELAFPTLRASVSVAGEPVRFALGQNGAPRLLVPRGPRGPKIKDFSTDRLEMEDGRYQTSGRSQRYLDITCIDKNLEAVFAEVVDKILRLLADGKDSTDAVSDTLEEFRALFSKKIEENVSPETIVGLIGELLLLKRLTALSPDAVHTWFGPEKESHDFRCGNQAIEVKTSARRANNVVHISSLEQLSGRPEGQLFLLHHTLERTEQGSLSVASLFDSISAACREPELLKARLSELECRDPHSKEWNWATFIPVSEEFYSVGEEFPRLTRRHLAAQDIPKAILDVQYSLDLSQASDFRMREDECDAMLKEFISCLPRD